MFTKYFLRRIDALTRKLKLKECENDDLKALANYYRNESLSTRQVIKELEDELSELKRRERDRMVYVIRHSKGAS